MDKKAVFKENIFLWYQFKENANGIVYAQEKEYVDFLSQKIKIVSEQTQEKIDYIIFVGETSVVSKIKNLESKLTEDTKIIMIGENELSAKNISAYPKVEEILKKDKINTISDLEKQMQKFGFLYRNLYYAFTNYDFVDILFEENYEVVPEQMNKYIPDVKKVEVQIFHEIEFLKKIIQIDKNLLKIFANSFFLEFSKNQEKQDVQFVSFNNMRKEEYRLMTVIRSGIVEKIPVNAKAAKHLENMQKNIEILKKQNIHLLDYTEKNGKCYSKLVKNKATLDTILAQNANDLEFVVAAFNKIRKVLENQAIAYQEKMEESLSEYEIDSNQLKNLKFLEHAFVDFVPKNCFEIDQEYYFFDQEWKRSFLPVEFILYRSIINCYDLVRKININELYEKLKLTEFIEIFEKINEKIMTDILDLELYEEIDGKAKTVKKVDNIINERKIALSQISDFEKEDLNKTQVIENFNQEQIKINQIMEDLRKEEMKKAQVIEDFIQEQAKKERIIDELKQEEKKKENYIRVLENIKTEKENEIQNLSKINQEKDEIIQQLNEKMKLKENQIEIYENMKAVKLVKKLRGRKK